MSAAKRFDPRELVESKLSENIRSADSDPISERLVALEVALQETRLEFKELKDLFIERERKGTMLVDAYKQVLADMTNLFEAQRHENIKREESLRFFLSSIEARLVADIRADLGLGESNRRKKGKWPFRKTA